MVETRAGLQVRAVEFVTEQSDDNIDRITYLRASLEISLYALLTDWLAWQPRLDWPGEGWEQPSFNKESGKEGHFYEENTQITVSMHLLVYCIAPRNVLGLRRPES